MNRAYHWQFTALKCCHWLLQWFLIETLLGLVHQRNIWFLPSLSFSFTFFSVVKVPFENTAFGWWDSSVEEYACLQTKAHLISGAPTVRAENWLLGIVFWPPHTLTSWCVCAHAPTTQTGIVFSWFQSFLLFLKRLLLRKCVLVETVLRRLPFLGWS